VPTATNLDEIRDTIGRVAKENALPFTIHKSGAFVVKAIVSALGDGNLRHHRDEQPFALGQWLEKVGFVRLNGFERREDGDVAVWSSVPAHIHGHAQIYFQGHWFSDFAQQRVSPWPRGDHGSTPIFFRFLRKQ
jgi:hypothetical protein